MGERKLYDISDCETLPEAIHQLRECLDYFEQAAEFLGRSAIPKGVLKRPDLDPFNLPEIIKWGLATSVGLKMAKAWMGKSLDHLGEKTPYKDGKRNSASDLIDTEDTSAFSYNRPVSRDQVVRGIDNLREEIKACQSVIEQITDEKFTRNSTGNVAEAIGDWQNATRYLTESVFVLGFVLGAIKDLADSEGESV